MCRTLLPLFEVCLTALESCAYRDLSAASQSNGDLVERALNGDLAVALMGDSRVDSAGEGGTSKLGKDVAPVGGADMG